MLIFAKATSQKNMQKNKIKTKITCGFSKVTLGRNQTSS